MAKMWAGRTDGITDSAADDFNSSIRIDSRMYREDIAANLTDQINDKLTGFGAVITSDALPKGSYLVGMLADDRTSRRNIVNWSDVTLTVK